MVKQILLLISYTLMTPLLPAQNDSVGVVTPDSKEPELKVHSTSTGVRLGLKASPNMHWLRPDSKGLDSDGNKTGASFGIVVDLPFGANGTYAFHSGVLLNYIGGKVKSDYTTDSTSVSSTQDINLRYIEIPLCLKLKTAMDAPMNFYGLLGTSAAINIRARSDASTTFTTSGTTTTILLEDEDIISDVASFKMALVVGAGLEYELSSGTTLFGGITYNNAFTNVLNKNTKNIIDEDKNSKLYADYLELSLGVFF